VKRTTLHVILHADRNYISSYFVKYAPYQGAFQTKVVDRNDIYILYHVPVICKMSSSWNKIGKVCTVCKDYTDIPKVFFTPHHAGHCCATMYSNNAQQWPPVMKVAISVGKTRQTNRQTDMCGTTRCSPLTQEREEHLKRESSIWTSSRFCICRYESKLNLWAVVFCIMTPCSLDTRTERPRMGSSQSYISVTYLTTLSVAQTI
jgi:hypothetical protein